MKRSFSGEKERSETAEKQSKRLCDDKDVKEPLDENNVNTVADSAANLINHDITLKEKNAEITAASDVPSLNISFLNNTSNSAHSTTSADISALQKRIQKLEADVAFYQKRHENVLKIQGAFNEKQMDPKSEVRSTKQQNRQRAKNAEERVEELNVLLSKSQEKVKMKNNERLQVQLQLNDSQKEVANERIARENALKENESLNAELKKLKTVTANKSELIEHLKSRCNNVKQEANTSEADTVPIDELQQIISAKENTINSLQELLKVAYESQENLKDQKREADSDKEIIQKRCNEFQEAIKNGKEKIAKLENQLEEIHEKFGQQQNDTEQENYEISRENESLKSKISGFREAIKEKNEQIGLLQKDLKVGEDLNERKMKEEFQKAKILEDKLAKTNEEFVNLMEKYSNLKTETEQENAGMDEKVKKLEAKNEALSDGLDEFKSANSKVKTEKEKIESDLDVLQKYGQRKADELFEEMQKHEKTKKLLETAISFNNTAYESSQQAAARATEAESRLLEYQTQCGKEFDERQKLAHEVEKIKEKMENEISEKEKAVKKSEELEVKISKIRDEALDLKVDRTRWQKKFDEINNQNKNEKENFAAKIEKFEAENKSLIESEEKLKNELADSKKNWKENVDELQKFVEKMTAANK